MEYCTYLHQYICAIYYIYTNRYLCYNNATVEKANYYSRHPLYSNKEELNGHFKSATKGRK